MSGLKLSELNGGERGPQVYAHYRDITDRLQEQFFGTGDYSTGNIDAYAAEHARHFPFTEPTLGQYFANTRRPQITYVIFSDTETYVFSGVLAVKVDRDLNLNPIEINRNTSKPATMEFEEGMRVNFDFSTHMEWGQDHFRNLVAQSVPDAYINHIMMQIGPDLVSQPPLPRLA